MKRNRKTECNGPGESTGASPCAVEKLENKLTFQIHLCILGNVSPPGKHELGIRSKQFGVWATNTPETGSEDSWDAATLQVQGPS